MVATVQYSSRPVVRRSMRLVHRPCVVSLLLTALPPSLRSVLIFRRFHCVSTSGGPPFVSIEHHYFLPLGSFALPCLASPCLTFAFARGREGTDRGMIVRASERKRNLRGRGAGEEGVQGRGDGISSFCFGQDSGEMMHRFEDEG